MSKFKILQSQFLTSLWPYLCIGSRNLNNISLTSYITVVEDNGSHFLRFLLRDLWTDMRTQAHSPPLPLVQGSQGRCSPDLVTTAHCLSRGRMSPGPSAHGNTGSITRMRHRTCEFRNTGTKLENPHLKIPILSNASFWHFMQYVFFFFLW